MNDSTQRAEYVSDLGISWAAVPLALIVAGASSLACGFLLDRLFHAGWYLIVLVPFLAAMALGGVVHGLVVATRCRNHLFALVLGAYVGVGGYLSYFHFGLQALLPPGGGLHLKALPAYIKFRMASDVQGDVGKERMVPRQPNQFANWVNFAFEIIVLALIPAHMGWRRARRAYSPSLCRWAQVEEKLVAPHQGEAMKAALEGGTLAEFMRDAPLSANPQLACRLTVEWFWTEQDTPLNEPVYLSINDHYRGILAKNFRHTLVRQVELNAQEVLRLRPVLPRLAKLLDVKHPELQSVPAQVFVAAPATESLVVAEVTPVPEPHRQQVRSKNYSLIVNLLGAVELLNFFGGIGLMAWGGWLASRDSSELGVGLLVVGAILFGSAVYISQCCMGVRENRWIHRRLRQVIAARPGSLVDLHDPNLRYVSIMPRESFEKVKWTMSSDLALMSLDERRDEIRLEGDCDRYRIPAAAIRQCQPVCFFHPLDAQHQNQLWLARLLIQRDVGDQELLLSIGHIDWWPRRNSDRKRIATEVCDEIDQLRGHRSAVSSHS